jgi:hypothetical protein
MFTASFKRISACIRQHTPAYFSIRQHTSAIYIDVHCVFQAGIRLYFPPFWRGRRREKKECQCLFKDRCATCSVAESRVAPPAYVSIRQHTSAYVSACRCTTCSVAESSLHTSAYVSIRQHTSAYVSICQHMPAYVSICC